MPWTVPAPVPADGPTSGADRPMLEGYLRWQRATLLNICAGLTGDQLARRACPPSTLSLLGLVRHMAKVERIWLRQRVAGEQVEPLFGGAGAAADFDEVNPEEAESAVRRLQEEWAAADRAAAGLDWETALEVGDEVWSLRMVVLHLIGEYARHNGHADMLREAIDGETGR